jgi:hypothetical protein
VNSNPDPESPLRLQVLADQAERYARHMMSGAGSVPPTVIADTPGGFVFCMPATLEDAAAKDRFAHLARLLAVAHGAFALATVAEAWVRVAKPGATIDTQIRPTDAPDRLEMVVVMLEDGDRHANRMLPIQRDAKEEFVGFGESRMVEFGAAEGRFARLMPQHPPTASEVAAAKAELLQLGVCVTMPGFDPTAN